MALTMTRDMRADRWRNVCGLAAAAVAVSTLQLFCATSSIAQVKAPSKPHLRTPKAAPLDSQADQLNAKWLSEHNQLDQQAVASIPAANPATPAHAS